MTLKAVFLDVGDTLLAEEPPRQAIYAEEARARGLAVEDEAMRALMARAHAELPESIDGAFRYTDPWFRAFLSRIFCAHLGLDRAELPGLADALFARFEDPATFRIRPGAEELFDALAERDLVVGLVSNWSARLPLLVARLGWDRRVDFTLCSALAGFEKPDPRIFRMALERARVGAAEALHAGDHPRKDGAARDLGIEVVLVDHRGERQGSGLPRVRDLEELRTYIGARTG